MRLSPKIVKLRWAVPVMCFLILLAWLVETPDGLLGKADAIGYAVCHRISLRSFHIDDRALPLCARCTGMYLGAVAGMIYQAVRYPRRGGMLTWKTGIPFLIFVAAWIIDGANSFAHLVPGLPGIYTPGNTGRLVTGLGMGLSIAAILYPAFNQTVWRDYDAQPVFLSLRSYLELFVITVAVGAITLTGNPMVLYPFALVSAGGVLMVLTLAYMLLWIILVKRENTIERFSQLLLPFCAGLMTALLQIGIVDLIRFHLTGTWDGFHL